MDRRADYLIWVHNPGLQPTSPWWKTLNSRNIVITIPLTTNDIFVQNINVVFEENFTYQTLVRYNKQSIVTSFRIMQLLSNEILLWRDFGLSLLFRTIFWNNADNGIQWFIINITFRYTYTFTLNIILPGAGPR